VSAPTIVEAIRLGAVNYVVKPGDPDGLGEIALEAAITQAMEKRQLVSEVTELRRQVNDEQARAFLWEKSLTMRGIAVMVDRVADNDVTVLIRGESGVGKELVARAIHDRSARHARPFVKVNCAALPDDLLESELFGHEKGAFTGAATMRLGKFEHADGGTLMLDEIGEMKAGLQAKLLHVLQDGEFNRLGGNKKVTVDVRIVAATNRDLEAMLSRSEFREDLYYRLRVIEMVVPPLRQRHDEIPELTEFFLGKYSKRYNRQKPTLAPAVLEALQNYSWPGNIRELENVVKRFVILQDEALLLRDLRSGDLRSRGRDFQSSGSLAHAPSTPAEEHASVPGAASIKATVSAGGASPRPSGSGSNPAGGDGAPAALTSATSSLAEIARLAMGEAERDLIVPTLRRVNWNRRKAAPLLGVSYKTLLNKIKEHGIVQG
jgi:two-component system response regulator AtoC